MQNLPSSTLSCLSNHWLLGPRAATDSRQGFAKRMPQAQMICCNLLNNYVKICCHLAKASRRCQGLADITAVSHADMDNFNLHDSKITSADLVRI